MDFFFPGLRLSLIYFLYFNFTDELKLIIFFWEIKDPSMSQWLIPFAKLTPAVK